MDIWLLDRNCLILGKTSAMLTIQDVQSLGFEYDAHKNMGGINPIQLSEVDCFYLALNDDNTNSNLRLPKTFCYLIIDKDGVIDLGVDETMVAYGFAVQDIDQLQQLLFIVGINVPPPNTNQLP